MVKVILVFLAIFVGASVVDIGTNSSEILAVGSVLRQPREGS